ncbi:MAG: hypothetical protein SF002_08290 [Alphaproteobacteria bacterium]|nr:hypothetical protein [Alphaproteobacteria bacterium]
MEQVRTIEGEVDEIRERIGSDGANIVEMYLNAGGTKEKVLAYAEKAKTLASLHEKMKGLAAKNGLGHIRDLKVKVEVSGIVKQQSASKDIIVTAVKIAGGG